MKRTQLAAFLLPQATMASVGHASNALPRRANEVVNCLILPGEKMADVQATRALRDKEIKMICRPDQIKVLADLMKDIEHG